MKADWYYKNPPSDLKVVTTLGEMRELKRKIAGQRRAIRSKEREIAKLRAQIRELKKGAGDVQ